MSARQKQVEIKSYRDLIVWQKSMSLVTQIYKITKLFPRDETYGLVVQIRRSSVSIPSNIAEGYGRNSTDDYIRFLRFAVSSLYEVQTQLEISMNIGYISKNDFEKLFAGSKEIERMLNSLVSKIIETKQK